jgi:response regulator RpfG family c-di-GMP phosphodiesterase
MPSQKPLEGVERKKTILIYSPDLNFCFSLSMLFQDRYNVITTTNIGMLETSVKNYDSDLAIVDAVPSEGLISRIDRLKDASGGVPVILLYVYNAKETALDKTIRAHVDCVFYKPFEISTVSKRIEEFLAV